jgi:hypothetical protein
MFINRQEVTCFFDDILLQLHRTRVTTNPSGEGLLTPSRIRNHNDWKAYKSQIRDYLNQNGRDDQSTPMKRIRIPPIPRCSNAYPSYRSRMNRDRSSLVCSNRIRMFFSLRRISSR